MSAKYLLSITSVLQMLEVNQLPIYLVLREYFYNPRTTMKLQIMPRADFLEWHIHASNKKIRKDSNAHNFKQ